MQPLSAMRALYLALAVAFVFPAAGQLLNAADAVSMVEQWRESAPAPGAVGAYSWSADHRYAEAAAWLHRPGEFLLPLAVLGLLGLALTHKLPDRERRMVLAAPAIFAVSLLLGLAFRIAWAPGERPLLATILQVGVAAASLAVLVWSHRPARVLAVGGVLGILSWNALLGHAGDAYVRASAHPAGVFGELRWWMVAPDLAAALGLTLVASAFLVAALPGERGRNENARVSVAERARPHP